MNIGHLQSYPFQVLRQIFRRLLGQRRDQHAFIFGNAFIAHGDRLVNLPFQRTDGNLRLQQPGRPDNLLYNQGCRTPGWVKFFYRFRGWAGSNANVLGRGKQNSFEPFRSLFSGSGGTAHGNIRLIIRTAIYQFKWPRSSGSIHNLVLPFHKLMEFQRPVIQSAGQAEPMLHQNIFAASVPLVHASQLRHRHMTFINQGQ